MTTTRSDNSNITRASRAARPLKIFVRPASAAEAEFLGPERQQAERAPISAAGAAPAGHRPPGIPATPAHDLLFRHGKTIPALNYVNLYVAGGSAWDAANKTNIDGALSRAMTDARLNEIIAQYFHGGAVSANAAGSHDLAVAAPATVSRGDVDDLIRTAADAGLIAGNLDTTVFNFLLPPGTVLTDDEAPTGGVQRANAPEPLRAARRERNGGGDHPLAHDPDDAASSLEGLGGYHGSVHTGSRRIYFAVGVFSERTGGGENGIVAFDEPWKNVVATFYHELQEARTDPDVEDAIRNQDDAFIGWNSAQGEEIGDFPVFEDRTLSRVFVEVPVAGGGTAPVQLMYSNRVHGPEMP